MFLLFGFKALNGLASKYISVSLLPFHSQISYILWPAAHGLPLVEVKGSHAFTVASPRFLDSLPFTIKCFPSKDIFKVKTHLFSLASGCWLTKKHFHTANDPLKLLVCKILCCLCYFGLGQTENPCLLFSSPVKLISILRSNHNAGRTEITSTLINTRCECKVMWSRCHYLDVDLVTETGVNGACVL